MMERPRASVAIRFPLFGKALSIAGVLLGLMLALQMVSGLVSERQGRQQEAQQSVADSLASSQVLVGPVLQRHCTESWPTVSAAKDAPVGTERREFVLTATPASLTLKAHATIEQRHRGIFAVNGYLLKAQADADWPAIADLEPRPDHVGSTLSCDAPVLAVSVADVRGLRRAEIRIGERALTAQPGGLQPEQTRGFHAPLPPDLVASVAPFRASVIVDLAGTSELGFAPVGETTHIELSSDWAHPSFTGRFLPNDRTIDAHGFRASWQVTARATSAPADLRAGASTCGMNVRPHCVETFGVSFIDPVSGYVLSDRATKYGLLFIALTFVGVGLVEVMRRLRVHPIQYLLVGSAIAVFFLLLVSLTEHVTFGVAYAASSAACTLLIGFYGSFVLRGWRGGVGLGAAIGLLYGALYVLLQLEQGALVLGSLLLFTVLTAVMVATRRIDWYALFDELRGGTSGQHGSAPQ